MSKVRGGSREELPHVWVSGGREDLPRVRDQGWRQGGGTPRLRSGVPGRRQPASEVGTVTLRSRPEPEARGGSWEEPPMPETRASGPGGASRGVVAAQAQEGLEELSRIESQEPRC